jgi:hypothetical protein
MGNQAERIEETGYGLLGIVKLFGMGDETADLGTKTELRADGIFPVQNGCF